MQPGGQDLRARRVQYCLDKVDSIKIVTNELADNSYSLPLRC